MYQDDERQDFKTTGLEKRRANIFLTKHFITEL